MFVFRYFAGGVVVGLLLCIAYDTSANVAALEGGRRHLAFGGILLYSLLAGLGGVIVASGMNRIDR